jgi:YVTN family beta-propeller protein
VAQARKRHSILAAAVAAVLVALALPFVLRSNAPSEAGPRPRAPSVAPFGDGTVALAARGAAPSSDPRSRDVYEGMRGRISRTAGRFPPRVYVPNNGSNTVSVINPRTFRLVRTFKVGLGPQHVTPSWDMRRLYVGNTYSNTLTELNPRTTRPVHRIPIPDPYNLYFTPDGKLAVDVAERMQTLFLYDPNHWRRVGSIHVPFAGIDHLDFSADGRYLLISAEFSGMVAKVDLARRRVVGSLHVGGSPVDVKLSPDGSVFYVANQERNGVSVIDPRTMKEDRFIRTGAGAHGFCVSRNTKALYVSNRLAGTISVLDFETGRVRHTWNVGGSPDMMQVSADGKLLWVSNRYDGTVSVVNTRSGRVAHTIRVGSSPHGLTLFPQPGRFSIGHNGVYR